MSLLDKLERAFGRFAIPGLTLYLVVGQVLAYFLERAYRLDPFLIALIPEGVIHGQYWRLVSFLFLPPSVGLIFVAFAWGIFYIMGNALEGHWGVFRYNCFLFSGYVLTVGAAFLDPAWPATNGFLAGSVFLAFAYLNPDFELAIFLVLPIKVRWLALLAWLGYAYAFAVGDWPSRFQVLASVGNFFLFFGHDIWLSLRMRRRRLGAAAARRASAKEADGARHCCRICGRTDKTDPQLDFRYCSKCAGEQCYCPEHIFNHAHVTEEHGSTGGN